MSAMSRGIGSDFKEHRFERRFHSTSTTTTMMIYYNYWLATKNGVAEKLRIDDIHDARPVAGDFVSTLVRVCVRLYIYMCV